ncbi:MAG TPA: hypothetical protein VEG27_05610 [Usitatibacter sp.]|nr:hypothetical protein [Usitatibacter sp.]
MQTREQLEKRVAELEKQVSAMGKGAVPVVMMRGIRKRSSFEIANLPLYDIAVGPDPSTGEFRGHARGILAIGDIASGLIALGGFARGAVAIGGLSIGLFTLGGLSIGLVAAVGGGAIGSVAVGGGAVGGVAIGGGAVGYYACGGAAAGENVTSATRRDPEARQFFRERGLAATCGR